MREIKKGIIHCLVTRPGQKITFEMVDGWHKERGFKSPSGIHCGYHKIINRDGSVIIGRPFSETGAHCKGHNHDSIGFALAGGWDGKFDYTDAQLDALWVEMNDAEKKIGNPLEWDGHNAYTDQKTCPNFNVKTWRYGDEKQ
jgi:hypothetical protein